MEEDESLELLLETSQPRRQSDVTPESSKSANEAAKKETTLLSYAQPKKSDDSSKVTSLENVMDAITSLSLKVDNIEMQHKSLTQLAFEDDNTQKSVVAMRQAENVLQLTKATQLIELFYAEKSQTAILRCSPCYKLHLVSKLTLGKLTSFQAN